jgi:hypothetical protein
MVSKAPRKHLRYARPDMTRRSSRALGLAPAAAIFVALACGGSHGSGDAGAPGDGGSASGGPSGAGTDPGPLSGTGGAVIDPGPTGGVGNAPTTGGVVSGGAAAGGFAGLGGAAGGGGAATGGVASGGTGGVQYPRGSCPALPPPNGSSCASYVVDPGFRCFYEAPACRVVSSCTAGSKWRSGCDATTGDAGAPSGEAGAGGAAN